jgi:hypothetical protein
MMRLAAVEAVKKEKLECAQAHWHTDGVMEIDRQTDRLAYKESKYSLDTQATVL